MTEHRCEASYGDIALERSSWTPEVCQCPDYHVDDALREASG